MQYYLVLLLVGAVCGSPVTYQYAPHYPLYQAFSPQYVYNHAPVLSQVSPAAGVVAAHPGVAVVAPAGGVVAAHPALVAAHPVVSPILTHIKNSILTDQDQQSTTLIENAPGKPLFQVLNAPLLVSGIQKVVQGKVEAVEPKEVAVVKTVNAPAALTPGYVAVNPGATHTAPLPVGPSGDGFYASHHVNLPNDLQIKLSRTARSAHHVAALPSQYTVLNPSHYLHHVPTFSHFVHQPPVYGLQFPFNTPVIDTPHLKTVPAKSVEGPVLAFSSPVVQQVVSSPVVQQVVSSPVVHQVVSSPVVQQVVNSPVVQQVPLPAPGYVAVNPGATHTAPLPVGPSGDGFYASHHVNLPAQ